MSILGKAFQMLVGGDRQDLATGQIYDKKEMLNAGARLYERADPVPMAPPIGYRREPSMMEIVKGEILKAKVNRLQEELGADTADEAEDFDVGDDDDDESPSSAYEFERHEHDLLRAFEKLQQHHLTMHEKYGRPLPDFMSGGEGGRPPSEGASAPVPAAAKAAPEAPKAPSAVPLADTAKS